MNIGCLKIIWCGTDCPNPFAFGKGGMDIGRWQIIWWGRWPKLKNLGRWPEHIPALFAVYDIRVDFGLFEIRRFAK